MHHSSNSRGTAMRIPSDFLSNTQAALAALSALLSIGGLLFTIIFGFFLVSALASIDSAISPPLDSAIAASGNLHDMALSAAASAESATGAINALSSALASYADSSKDVGDSISALAAVPPFSLDSRFSSAAASLKASSQQFSNASAQMNATAWGAAGATEALRKTADDIGSAKGSLEGAKFFFKSAIGSLQIAAIALFLALEALFSSVLLLSVSILLSHYPRLFEETAVLQGKTARAERSSAAQQNVRVLSAPIRAGGSNREKNEEREKGAAKEESQSKKK